MVPRHHVRGRALEIFVYSCNFPSSAWTGSLSITGLSRAGASEIGPARTLVDDTTYATGIERQDQTRGAIAIHTHETHQWAVARWVPRG
jgi:hypothetical protein